MRCVSPLADGSLESFVECREIAEFAAVDLGQRDLCGRAIEETVHKFREQLRPVFAEQITNELRRAVVELRDARKILWVLRDRDQLLHVHRRLGEIAWIRSRRQASSHRGTGICHVVGETFAQPDRPVAIAIDACDHRVSGLVRQRVRLKTLAGTVNI